MPTNNTAGLPNGRQAKPFDWERDWKRLQNQRRKRDDASYWNTRSTSFDSAGKPSGYTKAFLERAVMDEGDTVLDMGCGTGSIAIELAKAGHEVVAADFSEGMVSQLEKRMAAAGIGSVRPLLMAWEDDWEAAGLAPKSFDVAIASRSLAVADLAAALGKLSAVARKRCYVSCACGYSPRMDARVLEACGLENLHGCDHQYVFNILTDAGYLPRVDYLFSTRKDSYDSLEDAEADFGRMIGDLEHLYPQDQIEQARRRLREWLEGNLVPNEAAGSLSEKGLPEKALRLRELRIVPWAFISWEPAGA